jgi:hypothetical protein
MSEEENRQSNVDLTVSRSRVIFAWKGPMQKAQILSNIRFRDRFEWLRVQDEMKPKYDVVISRCWPQRSGGGDLPRARGIERPVVGEE